MKYLKDNLILHRDLKPGNIFMTEDNDVKIGDFGLSIKLRKGDYKRRTLCGTPSFMAPEIWMKDCGYSFEADVWALGIICYCILVGSVPFELTVNFMNIKKCILAGNFIPNHLPSNAKNFIKNCLVFKPSERAIVEELLGNEYLEIPKKFIK